jgi:hypothetical protein
MNPAQSNQASESQRLRQALRLCTRVTLTRAPNAKGSMGVAELNSEHKPFNQKYSAEEDPESSKYLFGGNSVRTLLYFLSRCSLRARSSTSLSSRSNSSNSYTSMPWPATRNRLSLSEPLVSPIRLRARRALSSERNPAFVYGRRW